MPRPAPRSRRRERREGLSVSGHACPEALVDFVASPCHLIGQMTGIFKESEKMPSFRASREFSKATLSPSRATSSSFLNVSGGSKDAHRQQGLALLFRDAREHG